MESELALPLSQHQPPEVRKRQSPDMAVTGLCLWTVLGWPRSSLGFFCNPNSLWKIPNELLGQPSITADSTCVGCSPHWDDALRWANKPLLQKVWAPLNWLPLPGPWSLWKSQHMSPWSVVSLPLENCSWWKEAKETDNYIQRVILDWLLDD